MNLKTIISKKRTFYITFLVVVAILFIAKKDPSLTPPRGREQPPTTSPEGENKPPLGEVWRGFRGGLEGVNAQFSIFNFQFSLRPHPIYGVSNYDTAFPDVNDEQLPYAQRHGITPQQNRKGLEPLVGSKLVCVGSSPFYHLDRLKTSVPYLVPKAWQLLGTIVKNFADSLGMKHLPQAQLIVTSVTRTKDDVGQLQTTNVNSVSNSCHFYGTTFDIAYTRYHPVTLSNGTTARLVRDDTLKWVLSEVLRDLRQANRCLVKHEKKQGCFHITVK